MTTLIAFIAGVIVGWLLRPRLSSLRDYVKSVWGE
jgi:hypothetical protein